MIVLHDGLTNNFFGSLTDIQNDFVIFDAYAEVIKDIADCHFENAFLDLQHFCEPEDQDCSMGTLIANGQANMFGLLGQITEIGQEIANDFPAEEKDEYRMQMQMMGDGFGAILRTCFGFDQGRIVFD